MSTPASAPVSTVETRALMLSLVATTVLGGGAIIWGIVSGAGVILFDGVYMMAGIVLVGVSLLASRAARSAASKEYPFGRHAATPSPSPSRARPCSARSSTAPPTRSRS